MAHQFQALMHLHELQYRLLPVGHGYFLPVDVLNEGEALRCYQLVVSNRTEMPYNDFTDFKTTLLHARGRELREYMI